jgi:hypothetical protein
MERLGPLLTARLNLCGGRHGHDRKRPVALIAAIADEIQEYRDGDSQAKGEGDEVPEGRKSQDENQGAAGGKEEADESTSERQLVHGDAGMTVSHGAPLCCDHHPTVSVQTQAGSLCGTQCRHALSFRPIGRNLLLAGSTDAAGDQQVPHGFAARNDKRGWPSGGGRVPACIYGLFSDTLVSSRCLT